MTSTETTSLSEASTEMQPWLTFLTKEASKPSVQKFVPDIANTIKDFLLSENENAASKTAKQIDTYPIPSPYMHLSCVYWTIFDTAGTIPYNDSKQEKLLNLLIELLKLPPRKFKTETGDVSYFGH